MLTYALLESPANSGSGIPAPPHLPRPYGGVEFRFSEENEADLAGIKAGDRVLIRGECKGLTRDFLTGIPGNVVLEDSTLIIE